MRRPTSRFSVVKKEEKDEKDEKQFLASEKLAANKKSNKKQRASQLKEFNVQTTVNVTTTRKKGSKKTKSKK